LGPKNFIKKHVKEEPFGGLEGAVVAFNGWRRGKRGDECMPLPNVIINQSATGNQEMESRKGRPISS